jgi:oligoribonuclease NrnB/cAMP/cGMP phosphodiesterase (DHH superfamily)
MIKPTYDFDLVLYHGNCPDGFGAAFVAFLSMLNDATYIPCFHGEPPPDVTGKRVLVLDFSWPLDVTENMHKLADHIMILDHHISAQRYLAGLPYAIFDMEKSGIGLTWDFFNPDHPRPDFVNHIEDRDLWRWKFKHSREFCAYVDMLPHDFKEWHVLMDSGMYDNIIEIGTGIVKHTNSQIKDSVSRASSFNFAGKHFKCVNTDQNISQVGNALSGACDIAVIWYYDEKNDATKFSLRTSRDDIDVSHMASKFGGGGHSKAAGFRLPGLHTPGKVIRI